MQCSKCGTELGEGVKFCPECGASAQQEAATVPASGTAVAVSKKCLGCGRDNISTSAFCGYCGKPFSLNLRDMGKDELDSARHYQDIRLKSKEMELQQQLLKQQEKQYEAMAKCPRCGSTSLSGNKKGYGVGKGVVGAALLGPVGLIAGNMGSKTVYVTCMKCGKRFKI